MATNIDGMARVSTMAVLVSLACGGCIVEVSFDPVGTAASVEGQWLVDGAPADASSCAALGITHVRVRFHRGERTSDHPRLVFPCEQGSFDTRPDRVVAGGEWTMQLLAVNNAAPVGASNIVAAGPLETVDTLDTGGHIVLGAVDFVGAAFDPRGTDAELHADWQIGGAGADAAACAAVGAAAVTIELHPEDDVARARGVVVASAPCAGGAYDSAAPELASGTYLVSAVLRDGTGAPLSRLDAPDAIPVAPGAPLAVSVDFRLAEASAHFDLRWGHPDTGAPSACGDAGVAFASWRLDRVEGATVTAIADSAGEVACAPFVHLLADGGGAPLTPGTYRLYFDGSVSAGGVKSWAAGAPCEVSIDGAGGLGLAACVADYTPP